MEPTTTTTTVLTKEEMFERYGWRDVEVDGEWVQVPLTLEDCLHPQEEDHVSTNIQHNLDCDYLADVFRTRPLSPPHTLVSCDLLVNWNVAGMREHSPDVAVFVGLSSQPGRYTGTLYLAQFGGRCELALEVVSPGRRENDVVRKFAYYHQIGIPLYVLIDQQRDGGPRTLRAYRYTPAEYVEIPLDTLGRVLLPILGLQLGMRDDAPVCFDATTGEEVEDFSRQVRQRAAEREEFRQYQDETDQTITEQVEARHKAEKEADKQRQEADKQRQEADKQRQEADKQRQAREELENQKRLADEQAAKRIRDLEEKLRLLQGGDAANPTT